MGNRVLVCGLVATSVAVLMALACRRTPPEPPKPIAATATLAPSRNAFTAPAADSPLVFTAIAPEQSGIDFVYYGSPSDDNSMTEQNGGGVALFDADGDGRLDVYLTNGSHFQRPAEAAGASHRLYRQIGEWQFADVTLASGLEAFGFGQGCAAADYDNDGFTDLFVAAYGVNRLWRNNGDGTFAEATHAAGVGNERWASSAAFADLDGDGNLDLYVANYVDWKPGSATQRRIPSPMDFKGLPDLLYRNIGDGRFEEVGSAAGIAIAEEGKGLAVGIGDLDGDDLPDVYVANDTTRNFLFHNRGLLKFDEIGVPSGCAVSEDGSLGSSMGVAIADYNRDGWFDLFVTNFAGELLDAYAGVGQMAFVASNTELGIDLVARPMLNFGIIAADFDLDLWPDLFFANGHVWDDTAAGGEYRMRPNLLRNLQGRRFTDVSQTAGDYFQQRWLGRAASAGDLDNDGDLDLVVCHLLDPPALLRNDCRRSGQSLRLKLIGTRSARQPLATRIEIRTGSETTLARLPAGESFQAALDDRVIVPLGNAAQADEVRVHWGPGRVQTWKNLAAGELHWLIESTAE